EEETLAECLQWNEHNRPPLDEEEVRSVVSSIGRAHAKAHETGLVPEIRSPQQGCEFVFDGDLVAPAKMLIKGILPTSGIAFIGGQSRAGKTFIAITMGVSLATSENFFGKRIKERVGVAYVAAEGYGMFAVRVAAAKLAIGTKQPIPFAWCGSVPAL